MEREGWQLEDISDCGSDIDTTIAKRKRVDKLSGNHCRKKRTSKGRKRVDDAVTNINKKSVAGQALLKMSAASRSDVSGELDKTLSKAVNKKVKDAVLMVQYRKKCEESMVNHFIQSRFTPVEMVRARRQTIWETHGSQASLKIGEWVEVMYDYSPGTCSDGGVAVVTAVHAAVDPKDTDALLEDCQSVDVKYLMFGRTERDIPLTRITIIPIPFKQGIHRF